MGRGRGEAHKTRVPTDTDLVTIGRLDLVSVLQAACGDLPEGSVGTFVGVCESSEVEDSILREMILHKDGSSESSDGRDVKAEFDYSEDLCYLYWHQVRQFFLPFFLFVSFRRQTTRRRPP